MMSINARLDPGARLRETQVGAASRATGRGDGLADEVGTFAMNHGTHQDHGRGHDRHAGLEMPGHAGHASATGSHAGHARHAGHSVAMFRDKFWLSFALAIPVIFWSTDVQHWLGYTAPSFPGSNLIAPILGTAVFLLAKSRLSWQQLNLLISWL